MDTRAQWLCRWIVLAFYHFSSTSAVCQNPPDNNRTVFVPHNGTAVFICNVTRGLEAQLCVDVGDVMLWWSREYNDSLSSVGIYPQLVDNRSSVINVNVNGNKAILNNTSIVCCFLNPHANLSDTITVPTFRATITIYDPPFPPTSLTVTEIVGTRVNISWRAPFTHPGVALWYHVRIADLSSTQNLSTLHQSNSSHYETSHLNCSQCEITVVAVNEAGESFPSDPVLLNLSNANNENGTNDTDPTPSSFTPPPNHSAGTKLFSHSPSLTSPTVPLLVYVVVAPVGGFVILVLAIIAITAAVKCRRTRSQTMHVPQPAGQRATRLDPWDTSTDSNPARSWGTPLSH